MMAGFCQAVSSASFLRMKKRMWAPRRAMKAAGGGGRQGARGSVRGARCEVRGVRCEVCAWCIRESMRG